MLIKFAKFGERFVHRDIKPENTLIDHENRVRITDFGLSKIFDMSHMNTEIHESKNRDVISSNNELTVAGKMIGTIPYMSPEQCMSKADIDQRSDIYSFGCVLYKMAARVCPFRGSSEEIFQKHLFSLPEPLEYYNSQVPNSLNELVCKCLKKDPKDRYDNFSRLKQELEKIYQEHASEILMCKVEDSYKENTFHINSHYWNI